MSLPIPSLAGGAGAFSLSSSSFSIDLPKTVTSGPESRDGSIYHVSVPGADGSLLTRTPSLDSINLTLSGILTEQSDADTVKRIVGQKKVTVSRGSRTLDGDVVGFRVRERVTGKLWDFDLEIQSTQHYWKGASNASASNPATVTNSGDLRVFPVIRFTGGVGGATAFSVSINGRTATFTGAVGNGNEVVIDCLDRTVTNDGINSLNSMNSNFFVAPPYLDPGSNTITISVTGAGSVVIEHTDWYL